MQSPLRLSAAHSGSWCTHQPGLERASSHTGEKENQVGLAKDIFVHSQKLLLFAVCKSGDETEATRETDENSILRFFIQISSNWWGGGGDHRGSRIIPILII